MKKNLKQYIIHDAWILQMSFSCGTVGRYKLAMNKYVLVGMDEF